LTGTQGVLIPEANIEDLMLRQDVVEAVQTKKFHIWPAQRSSKAWNCLRNVPGMKNGTGTFDAGTVFARVNQRLTEMAKTSKNLSKRDGLS